MPLDVADKRHNSRSPKRAEICETISSGKAKSILGNAQGCHLRMQQAKAREAKAAFLWECHKDSAFFGGCGNIVQSN
jgi:hypothetical protein